MQPDEALALSKASTGVVKHLPIPAKAIGPVADFSAATVAVRDIVGKRLAMDAAIARGDAPRPVPVVRMDGEQPFPTGVQGAPFVVTPQGVAMRGDEEMPSHMGDLATSIIPEGMTGDRELLERMGVSPDLADALVTEANGGTPVLPTVAEFPPHWEADATPGATVAQTRPEIISEVHDAKGEKTLEQLVRENGASETAPLLDLLAPAPTFEQH